MIRIIHFFRQLVLFAALLASVQASLKSSQVHNAVGRTIDRSFESLRNSPPELYAFLLRMPKGADLHNHLAGAVYAETFLHEAAAGSWCIDRGKFSIAAPSAGDTCGAQQLEAAQAESDSALANQVIDSLSMRDFVPGPESAHDHFFDTFAKFGAISHGNEGDYLAEVIQRAAEQNESYLELMALSGGREVSDLGKQAGLSADFADTRAKLLQAGMEALVGKLRERVTAIDHERIRHLQCDAKPDSDACRVTVRYLYQVLRGSPKEEVFAQTLAGFMLAASEPSVVGIDFVQPEDGFTSMRDYSLQMRMVEFLHGVYPKVHIALHAGELASGLVPPEGLRFHIREAVLIGNAERIGHGVDIMYERDSLNTLRTMRKRGVDVEINLTSNDVILGVKGNDHPLPVYLKYGVPVTLSTDDEGVSRTHLTQEFQRAVLTYKLTYAEVKTMVRNSIEHSFLPGASLWKGGNYGAMTEPCSDGKQTSRCRSFLDSNEKARVQADLEDRFRKFESEELGRR